MSEKSTSEQRKRSRDDRDKRDADEDITDVSSGEEEVVDSLGEDEDIESDEEFQGENPADKRRRLAKQYLENLKAEANEIDTGLGNVPEGENAREIDEYNNFDAADLDRDIIAARLKQDVAEQKGRMFRLIGDKLLISEANISFTRVGEKNLTGLSCHQSELNKFDAETEQSRLNGSNKKLGKIFAYTVSKDMCLTKYDITDFTQRPKKVKHTKGGVRFFPKSNIEIENTTQGHYDEILAVAASPDGKYVVTGGRDRKLIIWSSESLAPIKVIPTKDRRGQVLAMTFRKNSDQLYVSCADYKIRTYSINQFSQLEILYGHQDAVVDISALGMERCVTVGSRDRTAMLWKIPDETRLTFRGGEDSQKLLKRWMKANATENEDGEITYPDESEAPIFHTEGSIDVVSMIDDSHFITGSDNGNLALWSISKKKPIHIEREAHGLMEGPTLETISGESNHDIKLRQLQNKKLQHPYWITAIYAIPYSNTFISGSWNGSLKVWSLEENLRSFKLIGELPNCKGIVTKIQAVESGKRDKEVFRVLASVAKEHRLGRWVTKVPEARNGIYSATINQITF